MNDSTQPDNRITLTQIKKVLSERFPMPEDPYTDLFQSGTLDSMQLMDVIMLLEEHYGFELKPSDMKKEHFSTLPAITETINRSLNKA